MDVSRKKFAGRSMAGRWKGTHRRTDKLATLCSLALIAAESAAHLFYATARALCERYGTMRAPWGYATVMGLCERHGVENVEQMAYNPWLYRASFHLIPFSLSQESRSSWPVSARLYC